MSDPWFEQMDPVERALMFFNWIEDFNDEQKTLENQGYLIGSFINPEMVKKLLGASGETFESTDEEFEKLSEKILETNRQQQEKPKRKRAKKRLIKE